LFADNFAALNKAVLCEHRTTSNPQVPRKSGIPQLSNLQVRVRVLFEGLRGLTRRQ
jgi:hypothetical protein